MSEKRTGLGRGLDALLPGRQLRSHSPSADSRQQNQNPIGKDAESARGNGLAPTLSPTGGETMGQPQVGVDKDALAGAREIAIELIDRNPYQTRGKIDEAALEELAASIREQGVLQPILVREVRLRAGSAGHPANPTLSPKDGERMGHPHPGAIHSAPIRYQLMAGERRWLAAQRAGLKTIPSVVKQASDEQAMEITIIENLQREDLNPMEQARAFERLSREFRLTQEQIAVKTGKDRASVSNFLRLLKLPAAVQQLIEDGALTLGHGKVLMMLSNEPPVVVERVAAKAAESGMSVRELEEAIMKLMGPPAGVLKQLREQRDPNIRAAEEDIQRTLGCKVTIKDHGGKGSILLEYASLDDFDRIVEVLGKR